MDLDVLDLKVIYRMIDNDYDCMTAEHMHIQHPLPYPTTGRITPRDQSSQTMDRHLQATLGFQPD